LRQIVASFRVIAEQKIGASSREPGFRKVRHQLNRLGPIRQAFVMHPELVIRAATGKIRFGRLRRKTHRLLAIFERVLVAA
jgi:hypothetical protein